MLALLSGVLCWSAASQHPQVDSLSKQLKQAHPDTTQVKLLNALAFSLRNYSPDTAIVLSSKALKISRNINYTPGRLRSLEIAGIVFRLSNKYDTAYAIFDNLQKEAFAGENIPLLATSYLEKGRLNYLLGDIDQAMDTLELALELKKEIKDSAGIVIVLNEIGNNYAEMGYYSRALQVYQQSLTIDKALNDQGGISDRYNNIARLHSFKNDFKRAREYFEMSYDIAKSLNDKSGQIILSNNIGYVLKQQGRYDKALIYLFRSLKLQNEIKEVCGDIYAMYNIGSIYEKTDRLDSAKYYLEHALQKAKECNDQYLVSLALIDLGRVYEKEGLVSSAKDLFLEAYENATQRGLRPEVKEAALELSGVYEKLNQPTLSLRYFKTYHSIYDSLYNEENTARLARMAAEYEFEQQKQKETLSQQLQTMEREKKLANAIWVRNSFIVGFVVLALITFLIYKNYKRKIKSHEKLNALNIKIRHQKDTVATQAEELRSVNEEITQINENLEQIVQERTRVITEQNKKILEYVFYNSHQVRGPLARILGLVSLFEKQGISTSEIQQKLLEIKKEALDLDVMVKSMNRTLEKEKKSMKKGA